MISRMSDNIFGDDIGYWPNYHVRCDQLVISYLHVHLLWLCFCIIVNLIFVALHSLVEVY